MLSKGARRVVFPILSFVGIVSVGFASWAFINNITVEASASGTVQVTELYEGAPGKFTVNTGDDYTATDDYYTLVLGEDQTFDETVGIYLAPSVQFTFSEYFLPDEGHSYYMAYRVEYSATSIYAKYVEIPDALLSSSGSTAGGNLYQESIPTEIDVSTGATAMSSAPFEGMYSITSTFTPTFKWADGSKPTTRSQHNAFIEEVNSDTSSFLIIMILSYQ